MFFYFNTACKCTKCKELVEHFCGKKQGNILPLYLNDLFKLAYLLQVVKKLV